MHLVNQLLQRHQSLFDEPLLIVNPPNDQSMVFLTASKNDYICLDYRSHLLFSKDRIFEWPSSLPVSTPILLYASKSKALTRSLLCALASLITQPSTIYLVAKNNEGGKSLNKTVESLVDRLDKVDSARHCCLWQGELTPLNRFDWQSHASYFEVKNSRFITYPGVFHSGHLDQGSALLLETIELPNNGRLLDVGCGSGVIGLLCKQREKNIDITLCDVDLMALLSANDNTQNLNSVATIVASDGLNDITGLYDIIVSNPPFHYGQRLDFFFVKQLFVKAFDRLTAHAALWLVANQTLPYEKLAKQYGYVCVVKSRRNGFKVLKLTLSSTSNA